MGKAPSALTPSLAIHQGDLEHELAHHRALELVVARDLHQKGAVAELEVGLDHRPVSRIPDQQNVDSLEILVEPLHQSIWAVGVAVGHEVHDLAVAVDAFQSPSGAQNGIVQ